MRYLIYKIFSGLFRIAYNYKNSSLKEFIANEIRNNAFDFTHVYKGYKQKYLLSNQFKFNGLFILFYGEGDIVAGPKSYIGDYSTIYAHKNTKVKIGENVRIGHNVRIYTLSNIADQDFSKEVLKEKTGDVIVGDNSWIGVNVLINPGVKIGKNCVIGANSVVTDDVPDNTIYGGVPAKLIKQKNLQ